MLPNWTKSLFVAVRLQLFDLRPPALLAASIQFGVFTTINSLLESECERVPMLKSYCKAAYFETASGLFPTVVFWILAVALTIIVVPTLLFLWPVLVLGIAFFVAMQLPPPFDTIVWIGGFVLVFWIRLQIGSFVTRKTGEPPGGTRPPSDMLRM